MLHNIQTNGVKLHFAILQGRNLFKKKERQKEKKGKMIKCTVADTQFYCDADSQNVHNLWSPSKNKEAGAIKLLSKNNLLTTFFPPPCPQRWCTTPSPFNLLRVTHPCPITLPLWPRISAEISMVLLCFSTLDKQPNLQLAEPRVSFGSNSESIPTTEWLRVSQEQGEPPGPPHTPPPRKDPLGHSQDHPVIERPRAEMKYMWDV